MSWTTIVWSMLASASLTLALIHLFIWFRQPQQRAQLAFAIAAATVAVITLMELMAMHAESVAQMSALLRWAHLPGLVLWASIVLFVRFFFNTGRLWLAWTVCGLRALALLLSFATGQNLFFNEITGLRQVPVFGGEIISVAQGTLNPWYVVGPLSALALVAFVLDASTTLWRRGTQNDRRRAVVFSVCIVFFVVIAVSQGVLVSAGLINAPYIIGLYFMPTIIAMSYELSSDVLRSVQLTQRLQASKAELRKSKQRMSLAANAAELGLWEWEIGHDEVWCTDKGRALFGITDRERIDFERILRTLYVEDRVPLKQAVAKALAGGGDYESEFRVILPDGRMRWLATRGRVEFEGDAPMRMHGVAFDISRRKQAELEVQRQRRELTHLSRVTLLGELSGSLAHELNQPLMAILSNAQAAQRFLAHDATSLDEVRDILKDIVDEDRRAGEIIHRLRLLLKKGELQHQPLNLNEVVQEVLRLIHSDLVNNGIAVDISLAAELQMVLGDRVQIQQVLLNLLVNGCEAMAGNEALERRFCIRSAACGGVVQISISDQGPGVPPAKMDSIFEPFFTSKAQGMGLGLAVCRSIIAAHGGRLWAANNATRGASFYFELPAYSGDHP